MLKNNDLKRVSNSDSNKIILYNDPYTRQWTLKEYISEILKDKIKNMNAKELGEYIKKEYGEIK